MVRALNLPIWLKKENHLQKDLKWVLIYSYTGAVEAIQTS
jgi:hypothetical protein